MADLSAVTTNFLPTAHETFTDTLSATILALDATVFVTNLGEYTDGDVVVLTVEPGTANEATFTGVKASAPFRVTNCKWTEGNLAVGHSSGATIIDYDSATHYNMLSKALKEIMGQDGNLLTQPVRDALGLGASAANGWEALGYAPTTVVDNGNGSYTATFNGVDLTGITGVNDKMLLPRAATLTQCATFDGVNDYYVKVGPNKMAWTDDFTFSAWAKPAANATGIFMSRFNGTSGWYIQISATGHVRADGFNGGSGNFSGVQTNGSVTLNRWVHIAGLLDMSAFTAAAGTAETAKSWIMLNGIEQSATVSRGGTNPTSLIQAGNYEIGDTNAGSFLFNGKLAQVAVYNTRVLQTTIRASRNQPLVGNETGLASAHSLSNSLLDLNTTTPNDLTANGGVSNATVDSPFVNSVAGTNLTGGTRNYALIMAQTFSTNTVYTLQVAEGETIPTTTPPTSVSYSKQKSPYGFPVDQGKWEIMTMLKVQGSNTAPVVSTWYNLHGSNLTGGFWLYLPVGSWKLSYNVAIQGNGASPLAVNGTLSTANNTEIDNKWTTYVEVSGTVSSAAGQVAREHDVTVTTPTFYYFNTRFYVAGATAIYNRGETGSPSIIKAIPNNL